MLWPPSVCNYSLSHKTQAVRFWGFRDESLYPQGELGPVEKRYINK